jgi:Raf kinase inhibitor-like YbhB/YbcL family protein
MSKFYLGEITITSPAFVHGGVIPPKYTAEGEDISPELRFANMPSGTRELALVCHDPDAPLTDGFTHWVVYGISPEVFGIAEGGGDAFTQGMNDFGNEGYGGPAPPPGHGQHHYFFHLYALDAVLDAAPGLTRDELVKRIDEHIIEQNRVVGTFER